MDDLIDPYKGEDERNSIFRTLAKLFGKVTTGHSFDPMDVEAWRYMDAHPEEFEGYQDGVIWPFDKLKEALGMDRGPWVSYPEYRQNLVNQYCSAYDHYNELLNNDDLVAKRYKHFQLMYDQYMKMCANALGLYELGEY